MAKKSAETSSKKEKEEKKDNAVKKKTTAKKTVTEKKPAAKKTTAQTKAKTTSTKTKRTTPKKAALKKTPEKREIKKEKGAIPIEKIAYHIKKDKSEIAPKKKKPTFARQELNKFTKLKDTWRAPKGGDSKKAEGKRGKGKLPKIGYKNPKTSQGMHYYGFYPILVHNKTELEKVNPEKEGAIIASAVGRKKRNEIIKTANELKVTILNPRKGELE